MKKLSDILKEYQEMDCFSDLPIVSVTMQGHTGDTPLHLAVHRKDREEVETLLHAGADPNIRGECGYTSLMAAVSHDLPLIVELLLAAGGRQDIPNEDGLTILDITKSEGVRRLLKRVVLSGRKEGSETK